MDPWHEHCSFYLERWLHKHRIAFLTASVAAGMLVVVVNRGLSAMVLWLPWDKSTISIAAAMGLCLTSQLIGIPWFLTRMREAFSDSPSFDGGSPQELFSLFQNRLCTRVAFYVTAAFVLLPFIALDVLKIMQLGTTPFYAAEHTHAALLVDIFNILLGYTLLYFLAVILWMILIVAWTLQDAQGEPERMKVPVDILAPDGVGGLGSVQALVRSILTYYFFIVALLVISYLSPTQLWSYQVIFIIILFIAGILFFFLGFGAIRNLVRGRVAHEMEALNGRIRTQYSRFMNIVSGDDKTDVEALGKVRSVLDACYSERSRMMTLYEKNTAFDIRTVAQSAASIIIPLLAFVEQLSSGIQASHILISALGL